MNAEVVGVNSVSAPTMGSVITSRASVPAFLNWNLNIVIVNIHPVGMHA